MDHPESFETGELALDDASADAMAAGAAVGAQGFFHFAGLAAAGDGRAATAGAAAGAAPAATGTASTATLAATTATASRRLRLGRSIQHVSKEMISRITDQGVHGQANQLHHQILRRWTFYIEI